MTVAVLPMMCVVCCFSLGLLLLVSIPHVEGVKARGPTYDLQVHTVSQTMIREQGKRKIVLTVDFTASAQPQLQWTYADKDAETAYLTDTQLSYSGGQGRAVATYDLYIKRVTLQIGYVDTHYLKIFIRRHVPFDVSQTLNTGLSSVSPGYDIIYTRGESFQLRASIPRQIAEGFTWAKEMFRPNEYTLRLDACYVNQSTGHVLSSVDNTHDPDMSSFLQGTKYVREDSARWVLDFNTAGEDISGYFRLSSMYEHPHNVNDDLDQLVVVIWETMNVQVHNASTPGPFPSKYSYVGTGRNPKRCSPGDDCYLYCYGYANNITQVAIFKEGVAEPLQRGVHVNYKTSNHVSFHANVMASGAYTGNYVCQIVSSDGTIGEATLRVTSA